MNAYIAVTDRDWFDFIAAQPQLDEVNFWQPKPWTGAFRVLRRGEPLLFKLKAPVNAIAGGGFFERYDTLPLSLAWDAFGIKTARRLAKLFGSGSLACGVTTLRGMKIFRSAASY